MFFRIRNLTKTIASMPYQLMQLYNFLTHAVLCRNAVISAPYNALITTLTNTKNSRPEVFCKKSVLRNFAKLQAALGLKLI